MRADAIATMRLIHDAAIVEFSTHGLDTPLETIARSAGVSKGTIYNRFGSRDGLIDAVITDLASSRIEALFTEASAAQTPLQSWEASLVTTWRLQFESPAINDVLIQTHPNSASLTSLCTYASSRSTGLLREAQKSGDVRSEISPADIYNLILFVGAAARAGIPGDAEDRERLFTVLLRGLRQ